MDYASEELTIGVVATGFTAAKIANILVDGFTQSIQKARVNVKSGNIIFLSTGDTPDANTGELVMEGGTYTVEGKVDIRNFLMIRSGSADALVCCTYEY